MFIVRAHRGCQGESCRVCEEYLPGFFSVNGGVVLEESQELVEVVKNFCPNKVITVQEIGEEGC